MALNIEPHQEYLPPSQSLPRRRMSSSLSMTSINERTSVIHPIIRVEPPSGYRLPPCTSATIASTSSHPLGQLPLSNATNTLLPPFPARSDPFRLSATRSTSPSRYAFDSYRESQTHPTGLPFDSMENNLYAEDSSRSQAPSFHQHRRRYTSYTGLSDAHFR
jgi:hypothetical protein